jgi:hypothetical protein
LEVKDQIDLISVEEETTGQVDQDLVVEVMEEPWVLKETKNEKCLFLKIQIL